MKEKRKNEQAEKDFYSPVLLSQMLCAALVVIAFFCLKGNANGEELLKAYSMLLEKDFFTERVDTVFSEMKDYLLGDGKNIAVFGSRVDVTDEKLTPADVPEKTEDTAEATTAIFEPEKVSEIAFDRTSEKAEETFLSVNKSSEMVFPVEDGVYTSLFGARTDPLSGGDDYHNGVDIAAEEGERIRAVYDGVVRKTGYDSISGHYIFLTHKNGYESLYCHCSKILAREGAVIRQGETVALVGSTGYSTGPHLHYEIRLDGESIDPMPFLENAV